MLGHHFKKGGRKTYRNLVNTIFTIFQRTSLDGVTICGLNAFETASQQSLTVQASKAKRYFTCAVPSSIVEEAGENLGQHCWSCTHDAMERNLRARISRLNVAPCYTMFLRKDL